MDERRVNLCQVADPIETLTSSGESYPFFFDSGAKCFFELYKTKSVYTLSALNNCVSLTNIDTELCGVDKSTLLKILSEFLNAFINGFPKSRVTTGELEIRLIDPNKTVQRRPYRGKRNSKRQN